MGNMIVMSVRGKGSMITYGAAKIRMGKIRGIKVAEGIEVEVGIDKELRMMMGVVGGIEAIIRNIDKTGRNKDVDKIRVLVSGDILPRVAQGIGLRKKHNSVSLMIRDWMRKEEGLEMREEVYRSLLRSIRRAGRRGISITVGRLNDIEEAYFSIGNILQEEMEDVLMEYEQKKFIAVG